MRSKYIHIKFEHCVNCIQIQYTPNVYRYINTEVVISAHVLEQYTQGYCISLFQANNKYLWTFTVSVEEVLKHVCDINEKSWSGHLIRYMLPGHHYAL
jgi:hypothetical protein